MAKKTFFDAALEVLKEASGGPLHYKEIAERAIRSGYIKTEGKTPESSVGAQLYTHIKRAEAAGQEPKIRRVGRGEFALFKRVEAGPLKSIRESNKKVRTELFSRLQSIHPRAFENLVGELLANIGFDNVTVLKYSGDGGLDIEAELTVGGVTNVKTAVQVKRWKNNVSGKIVRELRGGLKTDQRGLIITTSSFTNDAVREAEAEAKTPISLIDGEKLLDLLVEYGLGVAKKTISYIELDTERFDELEDVNGGVSDGVFLGMWPLPGGSYNYVESALKIIKFVAQSEPTQTQLIRRIRKDFPSVKSAKTAKGYINVIKALGLIYFEGESVKITDAGSSAFSRDPMEVFKNQLEKRIAGIAPYLATLQSKPMDFDESHDFFKKELGVDWETTQQTKYRIVWLENVGAIKKEGEKYVMA